MILKKIKLDSSLVSNFFSLVILQGVNYIFPLITVPYLFRTLGIGTFGLISFATAFAQYFILLTDFGFNLYGVQVVSANRENKELRDTFFVNVLVAQLLLFLVGLAVLLIIICAFDKFYQDKWIYLLSFTTVFGSVLMPTWFFQGMEQMKYITKINIVTRTLAIILIFLFVKSDADYLLVPLFYGLGSIVSGFIALYIANSRFDVSLLYKQCSISAIKQCLKDSSRFFISRISVSLYTVSNSFILGLSLGNTVVGYYSVAEKLYIAIQSMYMPLNNALYPYMIKNKNISLFIKIFKVVVLLNCIVLPICIYNAEFIMLMIYKNVYLESVIVFKILLGVCIVTIPSILLGYPFLGVLGYSEYVNKTVVLSSLFHLGVIFILFLTNNISILTVSIQILLTELCVLLLRFKFIYTLKIK